MIKIFLTLIVLVSSFTVQPAQACLFGKVRIVDVGEDYKVRVVDFAEDLRVLRVSHGAISCGKWEFVDFGGDFKVRFVDVGEDLKIRYVEYGEGE